MSYSKNFREQVRQLEFLLDSVDAEDCCCCSVNKQQCFALVEIGRAPGISVKDLADRLHSDKSVVSRTVDDLVKKGYVVRKPSEIDRRFVELSLTDMGIERFEKIEKSMDDKFADICSKIPKDKQKQVLESLELINSALEASK
ncbi:MarR family winged helix-turn-helix transcriptional regulator [Pseudobutyrivibrio sp.]|uniref:MarR family winged helix-turn-helix transcriptional regulator n=1 Tax=Pseudobutyrivibrio sp. TaxID=2014367 RepID=UPI001B3DAE87|nr:MarR family transcriptional regulator [Pseudobutyrivibrio sp.]MBP5594377.1 MarR family transcriptional regulator [Pseudobutyrivibrio sp.]MBR5648813.1 MarR family transcriptional regulator [Pseudobutyrivibrio sp.]